MWYIQRDDEYLRSESLWSDQVSYYRRLFKIRALRFELCEIKKIHKAVFSPAIGCFQFEAESGRS